MTNSTGPSARSTSRAGSTFWHVWRPSIRYVTPPETRIVDVTTLGPESLEEPNSIRFRFTNPPTNENPQGSSDNGTAWWELGFECSLDDGPWESCDPIHYVLLEELAGGQHTLQVRAVDAMIESLRS